MKLFQMRYLILLLAAALLAQLLGSCKQVIGAGFGDAAPRYVVAERIGNGVSSCVHGVIHTRNFSENDNAERI